MGRKEGTGLLTSSLTKWAAVTDVQLQQRNAGEVLWESVVARSCADAVREAFDTALLSSHPSEVIRVQLTGSDSTTAMLLLPCCPEDVVNGVWVVVVDESGGSNAAAVWQQEHASGWQTLGADENAKLEEAFVQNLNRVPLVLDGRQMLVWLHRMVAIDVDL